MEELTKTEKQCKSCWKEKSYEEFPKRKESKDGYRSICQICYKARMKRHNDKYQAAKQPIISKASNTPPGWWVIENQRLININN